VIFAIAGIVIALLAGGLYAYRDRTAAPVRTPEETVREFLVGVFVAADPERVRRVVCAGWDPADVITRTVGEVGWDVHVSWDGFATVVSFEGRTTIRARLGIRRAGEQQPGSYQQWRFNLVDEEGWRVCEARPFVL
jgi:hypothetical protein